MRRVSTVLCLIVLGGALLAGVLPTLPAADVPSDRVVAMYFHRTQRCPTCLKLGSYSEEAVKAGFPNEVQQGTVSFHYVDFQDPRNAALARAYHISGPTLILAEVSNNKVVRYANLTEIWTKVGDKQAFLKYVQDQLRAMLQ